MRTPWLPALLAVGLALGCTDDSVPDNTVLVLSPYTGTSAADGFNREQALRLLTHHVDVSELNGDAVDFLFYDTGHATSSELQGILADDGLMAVVGPDDLSTFSESTGLGGAPPALLDLLPGIATEDDVNNSGDGQLWLGPSAEEMACTLAENVYDFEDYRVAVVQDDLALHQVMAETLVSTTERYDLFGRSELLTITLGETHASRNAAFRDLTDLDPDAIVLLTSSQTAAKLIQDWSAARGNVNWYLGPGLLSNELLENVPLEQMEGAVGIAPGILANNKAAKRFKSAFVEEMGTEPFPSTYYYVDAAVIALASMQAAKGAGTLSRAETLQQAREVSTAPGQRFEWDELETALKLLREGEAVDYQGVTGALTIDKEGQFIRVNSFDLTRVEDGLIVPLFQDTCI